MDSTIDVVIPLDPEAARELQDPSRREAAGRYLSSLLRQGGLRDAIAEAIAKLKEEGRANGLTDETVNEELEAWRTERTR